MSIDIKDKLTVEEKQQFANIRLETVVLEHLLNERKGIASQLLGQVMTKLGYNPMIYSFSFNAGQNKWEMNLKTDALVVKDAPPKMNRQERRRLKLN